MFLLFFFGLKFVISSSEGLPLEVVYVVLVTSVLQLKIIASCNSAVFCFFFLGIFCCCCCCPEPIS